MNGLCLAKVPRTLLVDPIGLSDHKEVTLSAEDW